MLLVIVGLVAGEEDEVGVLGVDVTGVFLAQATVFVRVAREGGEGDFIFSNGVFANESFEGGFFAVAEAVFFVLGHVPIFDSKGGGPAEVIYFLLGDFDPFGVVLNFEADGTGFFWVEGVELSGEFENSLVSGVDAKGDGFIARDFEVDNVGWFSIPPIIGGESVFAFLKRGAHERFAVLVCKEWVSKEGDTNCQGCFH